MYTLTQITELRDKIETELQKRFPYFRAPISTLGGEDRASIILVFALDKREDWAHGYIENSRYVRLSINNDRSILEAETFIFPRGLRMRSFKALTTDEVLAKLIKYFDKVAKEI